MAKIQVTSVEMRTRAQAIVLDASFVAKAIRAQCVANNIAPIVYCIDNETITNEAKQVFDFVNELAQALLDEEKKDESEN